MDLTIFGKTPLIINTGRLKSFLTLSKMDKSLTALQTCNPFAPRSYLQVDLTGTEFIQDNFVEMEQISCLPWTGFSSETSFPS